MEQALTQLDVKIMEQALTQLDVKILFGDFTYHANIFNDL